MAKVLHGGMWIDVPDPPKVRPRPQGREAPGMGPGGPASGRVTVRPRTSTRPYRPPPTTAPRAPAAAPTGERGGGQGRVNQDAVDAQIERDARAHAQEKAQERQAQAYAAQRQRIREAAQAQLRREALGSRGVTQFDTPEPPRRPATPVMGEHGGGMGVVSNLQRGAAPTGGPGRDEVNSAIRLLKNPHTTVAQIQQHLRGQGYDIAVDGQPGPQTQAAYNDYLHTLNRSMAYDKAYQAWQHSQQASLAAARQQQARARAARGAALTPKLQAGQRQTRSFGDLVKLVPAAYGPSEDTYRPVGFKGTYRPPASMRDQYTQMIQSQLRAWRLHFPGDRHTDAQLELQFRREALQPGDQTVQQLVQGGMSLEDARAWEKMGIQNQGGAVAFTTKKALEGVGQTLGPTHTISAILSGHLPSLKGVALDAATVAALAGPDELMAPLRFAREALDIYRADGVVSAAIKVATASAKDVQAARRAEIVINRAVKAARKEGNVAPVFAEERQPFAEALQANPNMTPGDRTYTLSAMDAAARSVARLEKITPEEAYAQILHDVHYRGIDPAKSDIAALHRAQTDIERTGLRPEAHNVEQTPAEHFTKPSQETIRAQAKKLLADHKGEVVDKKGNATLVIPEQYRSVEGMTTLLNKLYDHGIEASQYRKWYELDAQKILDHFGGDRIKAERLVDMIAILSPKAEVYSYVNEHNNLDRALKAWNALDRGEQIPDGVILNAWQRPALEKAYKGEYAYPEEELKSGIFKTRPKTSRFARNFLYHINPEKYRALYGDEQFGTMDVWMAHAFDYPADAPAPGGATYAFMNDATKAIGDQLGWSVPETQAAIWVTAKADKENKTLAEAATGFGHGLEHIPQREAVKGAIGGPGETYNDLIMRVFRTLTGRKGKPKAITRRELDQHMTQWVAEHPEAGSLEHFAAYVEPLRTSFQETTREVGRLGDDALTSRVEGLLGDGNVGEALQELRGHPEAQDALTGLLDTQNRALAAGKPDPKIKAMIQETDMGNVITFFQRADVSSAIHELAHAVEPFLPASDRIALARHGVVSDEDFARTVERYFAEGIAPSPELEAAYQHLSEGMLRVYGTAEAIPGAKFNPEIRHVLDRFMTAAEQRDPQFAARLKGALAQEDTGGVNAPQPGEGFDEWRGRLWDGLKQGRTFRGEPGGLYRAMSDAEYEAGVKAGRFTPLGDHLYVTSDPDRLAGGAYGGKGGGHIVETDPLPTRTVPTQTAARVDEKAVDEIPGHAVRRVFKWDPAKGDHVEVAHPFGGKTRFQEETPDANQTISSYVNSMKLEDRPVDWAEIHDALTHEGLTEEQAAAAIRRYRYPARGQEEPFSQKLDRLVAEKKQARAEWEHAREAKQKEIYRRLRQEDKEAGRDVSGKSVSHRQARAIELANRDPHIQALSDRMHETDVAHLDVTNPQAAERSRQFRRDTAARIEAAQRRIEEQEGALRLDETPPAKAPAEAPVQAEAAPTPPEAPPAEAPPPEKPPEEPPAPPAPEEPPPDPNAIPDYLRNDRRFWRVGRPHEISRWGQQELDRYREALRKGDIKPGEQPEGYWTPEQQRLATADWAPEGVAGLKARRRPGAGEEGTVQVPPWKLLGREEESGTYTGMTSEPIEGDIRRRPGPAPPTEEAVAHADANGIPIHEVNGTGENGRVTKPDVEEEAFRRGTTPEQRLQKALKGVKIQRGKMDVERSKDIARRGAALRQAQSSGTLEERLAKGGKALQGEMPTWIYQGVRRSLSQDDIEHLAMRIWNHPNLTDFQQRRAAKALQDLFQTGRVLQPNETNLLTHVFGRDTFRSLIDAVGHPSWKRYLVETLNIPRAFMASVDLSAPFRQGLVISTRHPDIFFQNFRDMVHAFGSEEAYRQGHAAIVTHANYPMMETGGLAVTDLGDITKMEEAFSSHFAEKLASPEWWAKTVTGGEKGEVPKYSIVRASDRAYTLFLAKTRADVFNHLIGVAQSKGVNVHDEKFLKELSAYINMATGRGQLGLKALEDAATVLNATLFSPRLLASRIQFGVAPINPRMYMNTPWGPKMHPFVRNEILRSWGQLSGAALSVLGLAISAGAITTGKWVTPQRKGTKIVSGPIQVEFDPRNSDFAKIRMHNTRIDFLGSFQQPFVLFSRVATLTSISSTTGKVQNLGSGFAKTTGFDIITRFMRGKLAPIPSVIADSPWVFGQTFNYQKPTVQGEIAQHLVPLAGQDAYNMFQQTKGGPAGVAKGVGAYALSGLGFGVQSYGAKAPNTPVSRLQQGAKMAGLPPPSKAILETARVQAAIASASRKGKIDQDTSSDKAIKQMQARVDGMRKLYQQEVGRPYKPKPGATFVPNPTALDEMSWDVGQIGYDLMTDKPGMNPQGVGELQFQIDKWRHTKH